MQAETISLRVGYKNTKVTFHLRVISLEDETLYTQRYNEIKEDSDQYEKEYRCMLDALGQWSAEMPTYQGGVDDTGKPIEVPLGEGTYLEALRDFFKERTNQSERIIRATIISYRNQLTPDVSFL